jgi:hypothetical protein
VPQETFDDVVSIEGSIRRARLARLRTRDLPGVTIVCAPFQELAFTRKFDVIFCVGVYEYSSSFVDAADPYDAVLRYFSEMLTPNGVVVIAIENQFGLKYFSSATEDHVGVMFEARATTRASARFERSAKWSSSKICGGTSPGPPSITRIPTTSCPIACWPKISSPVELPESWCRR